MPPLNWDAFVQLPGSADYNFECYAVPSSGANTGGTGGLPLGRINRA
jgi:hypothetical protein